MAERRPSLQFLIEATEDFFFCKFNRLAAKCVAFLNERTSCRTE